MKFTYATHTTKIITLADDAVTIFMSPKFPSQCVWTTGGERLRIRYVGRGVVVMTPYRGRVPRSWRTWRKL